MVGCASARWNSRNSRWRTCSRCISAHNPCFFATPTPATAMPAPLARALIQTVTKQDRIVKPYPDENYGRLDARHRSACTAPPTRESGSWSPERPWASHVRRSRRGAAPPRAGAPFRDCEGLRASAGKTPGPWLAGRCDRADLRQVHRYKLDQFGCARRMLIGRVAHSGPLASGGGIGAECPGSRESVMWLSVIPLADAGLCPFQPIR
jgi:hypothetical protein